MTQHLTPNSADQGPVPGLEAVARERLPSRDLWVDIAPRLHAAVAVAPSRQRQLLPYGLAASICLALLTGVLLRSPVPSQVAEPAAVATATSDAPGNALAPYTQPYGNRSASRQEPARPLRSLRNESLDNAPVLTAERAGSGLMKATYAAKGSAHAQEALLRANLRLVKQAERELRRAIREEPESSSLQDLLLATEKQRAQLTAMLIHSGD